MQLKTPIIYVNLLKLYNVLTLIVAVGSVAAGELNVKLGHIIITFFICACKNQQDFHL